MPPCQRRSSRTRGAQVPESVQTFQGNTNVRSLVRSFARSFVRSFVRSSLQLHHHRQQNVRVVMYIHTHLLSRQHSADHPLGDARAHGVRPMSVGVRRCAQFPFRERPAHFVARRTVGHAEQSRHHAGGVRLRLCLVRQRALPATERTAQQVLGACVCVCACGRVVGWCWRWLHT